MKILGIDPGYAILGYGVIEMQGNCFSVCTFGAITTDASLSMPERLKTLYQELMAIIQTNKPDAFAVEELFFNKNTKTALMVGQARGVILLCGANSGLPVFEYTPLQVKQGIVGYGRADKKQVQVMVKTILNLKEVPKPDDTADALAVAICHGHSAQYQNKIIKAK